MNILRAPSDLPPGPRRVCVAIGVFDGVHLGHQQVIRQTVADAEQYEALSVVVTFDRHPNAVVAPAHVPPPVYSLTQKLSAIGALGVEATWVIQFDEAFSRQTGEEFVRALARDFCQLRSICVGSRFTFGHRRSGNVELLRRLGAELHFSVHGLAAVSLDGEAVSSTRIREAILSGQFDTAGQMLGRAWSLAGPVVKGDQLGTQLGYPTANLEVDGRVLPPNGVYAVHVRVGSQIHRGVINIGVRPTLATGQLQVRVEAHLLDFTGDLYGQDLELTFVEKLRAEQKFSSLEALREQIVRDVAKARERFAG